MASAIYRAGDIEAIVEMYAEGAVVRCGCGGVKTITGNEALRAYRIDRLRVYPAGTLDDLNPWHEGVIISYVTKSTVMSSLFSFDVAGGSRS
jgi:hypothetical protein